MENVNRRQEYLFNNLHKFQNEDSKAQQMETLKPSKNEATMQKDNITKQIQQKWYRDQLHTQIGNVLLRKKERIY